MKRFMLVFAGTLTLLAGFLAGCETTANSPTANATNVYASVTALSITPSPTNTPAPNEMSMVEKINGALNSNIIVDDLSKAIDAHYQVMDIHFEPAEGVAIIFQLDIACICVRNINCCTPERTFVVLAHAMKAIGKQIAKDVPDTIMDVQISCSNNTRLVGLINVPWSELKKYIVDSANQIGGYQLGGNVTITYMP